MTNSAKHLANLNRPVLEYAQRRVTALHQDQTVGDALAYLRGQELGEKIVYFYVVDELGKLRGVIPARALLLSPPEAPIVEIMLRNVIAIPADATVLDACEFFVLHRFLAFPVVDAQRRLIGAIDVELYTDELRDLVRHETGVVRRGRGGRHLETDPR